MTGPSFTRSIDLAALLAEKREVTETRPFPRVFWVALLLELLERLAFYGVYVNLQVYLNETVHLTDIEIGSLLGVFALVRSWVPVGTGALADRIGFRTSLSISFILYVAAYALLYAFPSRPGAWAAVMMIAIAGAFLKPVIPATVRKYSPEERRAMGFSYFYASVNAGSVVGKVATKIVRGLVSLRSTILNAIVASFIGLGVAIGFFKEPPSDEPPRDPLEQLLEIRRGLFHAFTQAPLVIFLVLIAGYYLLIEQFYQTFPTYIVRTLGKDAPREYITLINPAAIAIFQVLVGRISKRLHPVRAMALGVLIGSGSMLLMGAFPTLIGACGSFFIFACAEMVLSPRYYEYISSFAPKGREGMYMGLAIVPVGIGGLAGGVLSGRLIAKYLPEQGARDPLAVWGTYAAIGVGCAALLAAYGALVKVKREPEETPA